MGLFYLFSPILNLALREQLNDVKYEALARSSELMEKSRESNIQRYIKEQGSELQIPTKAPVVIKK